MAYLNTLYANLHIFGWKEKGLVDERLKIENKGNHMISVITETLCVSLPDRFVVNQPLTAREVEALEAIRTQRLKWIVGGWLTKNMIPAEAQVHLESFAKSYELSHRPLTEPQDPIDLEAMMIARELVRRKVADKDLNLEPESIEVYVAELAKIPGVRDRASVIVKTRREAVKNLIPGVT